MELNNENNLNNENSNNIKENGAIPNSNTMENKNTHFKVSPNNVSYQKTYNSKSTHSVSKGFIFPLLSGALGATLVIGTIFGVPQIKNYILGAENGLTTELNKTPSSGYVSQVSLSNFSDTSIYAANKVLPSIVGIKVEYNISSPISIFGTTQNSTGTATGSGIIISQDGYILTNNHIVATSSSESYYEVSDATKVTVTLFGDETEYPATIIGKDEQTDLAVIKVDKTGLTAAEFADSDNIKVGEFAMAVGNPLGLGTTVTTGSVSALNRKVTDDNGQTFTLIQTDAAINSGNSGGALVNSKGQVIGINTLKLSGNDIEGIGFAIPINSTTDIVDQLIEYNKVKRPYIGITGMDLNKETAEKNNLVVGIYIKSIEEFSAAEKAGLKIGDVIIGANGKSIATMDELNEIKNTLKIGDEMTLKINRDKQEKDLTIKLGEQP